MPHALTREWGMCATCGMCYRSFSTSNNESKFLQFRSNDPVMTRLANHGKKDVFLMGFRGVLIFRLFLTILRHLIIKKTT